MGGVLDLAASGAGQVAAEQRFEHEHERIAIASGQLLAQDVGGHGSTSGIRELPLRLREECCSMIPDSSGASRCS